MANNTFRIVNSKNFMEIKDISTEKTIAINQNRNKKKVDKPTFVHKKAKVVEINIKPTYFVSNENF